LPDTKVGSFSQALNNQAETSREQPLVLGHRFYGLAFA
jgi:hypothetical protein